MMNKHSKILYILWKSGWDSGNLDIRHNMGTFKEDKSNNG